MDDWHGLRCGWSLLCAGYLNLRLAIIIPGDGCDGCNFPSWPPLSCTSKGGFKRALGFDAETLRNMGQMMGMGGMGMSASQTRLNEFPLRKRFYPCLELAASIQSSWERFRTLHQRKIVRLKQYSKCRNAHVRVSFNRSALR